MLSAETTAFQSAIADLQRDRKLPESLSPRQVMLLQRSFNQYANEVGQRLLDDVLSDYQDKISQALSAQSDSGPGANGGPGASRSELLYNLTSNVGQDIADHLKWGMQVAQEVVAGAGRYLNQNISPEAVDEYPALALQRFFSRHVPRGWRQKGKTLIPVPDDNWPSRWAEAGSQAGGVSDTGQPDWLPWSGDSQHGRGIALKSSGIWEALGTLRDDSLGNPFPPFAFNSGFMTKEISRSEATALGLLKPGQKVQPAAIDIESLFNFNQ